MLESAPEREGPAPSDRPAADHQHRPPLPSEQHRYPGLAKLSETVLHERRELVFLVLAGIFLGTLAMLNILGISRFIDLSFRLPATDVLIPMPLAVGILPYPITFLCTDFIAELFGRRRASAVVWVGLVLNAWVMLIIWAAGALPGAANQDDGAFFAIRRLAFGAVTASMIAYLAAQMIDVYLFHFWKRVTDGRHLWLRNNGSTLVSQLVDTTAVILITHSLHGLPVAPDEPLAPQLATFIGAGYAFKAAAAALDTIPFYVGVGFLVRFLRLPPPGSRTPPPAAAAVEAGVG